MYLFYGEVLGGGVWVFGGEDRVMWFGFKFLVGSIGFSI